jgi:hypothetical protein
MGVELVCGFKFPNDPCNGAILLFSSSVKKPSALSILTKHAINIEAVTALANYIAV